MSVRADGGIVQIAKKGIGMSLTHGTWGAIEGFVGEEEPIEHVLQGHKAQLRTTNTSWVCS